MYNKTTKILGVICAICVVVVLFIFVFGKDVKNNTIVIGVESGNFASKGTAYILQKLIEDNYDIKVDIKEQGGIGFDRITTEQLFEDMDVNLVHINPMVRVEGNENIISLYVDNTQTVVASPHRVRSSKGLCIHRSVADDYNIRDITDLKDKDVFEIFKVLKEKVTEEETEVDIRGEILAKGEDKSNIIIEQIRAKSYGYDNYFKISSRNEDLLFKEIGNYIEENIPFIFQCEAPHRVWERYDLVMLEEEIHDSSLWNVVYPSDSDEWLEKSYAVTSWKPNYFRTYYVRSLEEDYYEIARFLNRVKFQISDISKILKVLEIDKRDPKKYAEEWIIDNEELIGLWIE